MRQAHSLEFSKSKITTCLLSWSLWTIQPKTHFLRIVVSDKKKAKSLRVSMWLRLVVYCTSFLCKVGKLRKFCNCMRVVCRLYSIRRSLCLQRVIKEAWKYGHPNSKSWFLKLQLIKNCFSVILIMMRQKYAFCLKMVLYLCLNLKLHRIKSSWEVIKTI